MPNPRFHVLVAIIIAWSVLYRRRVLLVDISQLYIPHSVASTHVASLLIGVLLSTLEILLITGFFLGVIQLAVFPQIIKIVGIDKLQRAGWVLGAVAFVLVPNSKVLSWNSPSLFAVGVTGSLLVNCSLSAIVITLMVASTNIVPSHYRGKMSGMFNTAQNLGRFVGPVVYSTTYAFSISSTARSYPWMNHRFVFYASTAVMALLANLGWRTLTTDILIMPAPVHVSLETEEEKP